MQQQDDRAVLRARLGDVERQAADGERPVPDAGELRPGRQLSFLRRTIIVKPVLQATLPVRPFFHSVSVM